MAGVGGETNLETLMASMSPQRRPGRYVFVTVADRPGEIEVLASVVEPEGLSLVLTQSDADRLGLTRLRRRLDHIAGALSASGRRVDGRMQ